jgi:hypothetical protein
MRGEKHELNWIPLFSVGLDLRFIRVSNSKSDEKSVAAMTIREASALVSSSYPDKLFPK